MTVRYKPSNYNHVVALGDKVLVFNGVSSALIELNAVAFERLRPYLFGASGVPTTRYRPPVNSTDSAFDIGAVADDGLRRSLQSLADAQYLVEESVDELEYLRHRYRRRQQEDPLLVMVTTTMDCNLDCYYCYEDKYASHLSEETCNKIFAYIQNDLHSRAQARMHLSWYGGEPMLNPQAIEYLSRLVTAECERASVRYTSSMVSNGTVWPEDPEECAGFVRRNHIGSIQFSFDGLPRNHNKRRHFKDGNAKHAVSSFDYLCNTVDALRGHARLYLRINLDRGSQRDAFPLADFFRERGWLYPGSKVYPYLAPLGPYTDACESVNRTAIDLSEFDELNNEFRTYLSEFVDIREFSWGYYPRSLQLNCSAVAEHSVIFGPDGAMYKCPHDLGVHVNSHGHVGEPANNSARLFPILQSGRSCQPRLPRVRSFRR